MAFVLEDGTGIAGANALIDVAFLRLYQSDRGRTALSGVADAGLMHLIVRATDYTEARWRGVYKGSIVRGEQGLSWPRTGATDESNRPLTGVPLILKQIIAELCERAEGLDRLISDPPPPYAVTMADGSMTTMTTGEVMSQTDKVGPITRTRNFSNTAGTTTRNNQSSSSSTVVGQLLGGVTVQAFPGIEIRATPLLRTTSFSSSMSYVRN